MNVNEENWESKWPAAGAAGFSMAEVCITMS
jgi:hypothetical protein